MWPGQRRRQHGGNIGILLLFLQLAQAGFDRIPPVTLGTIALNVSVYLGLIHQFLKKRVPGAHEVCIGIESVWYRHDYFRLLKAAFFHADDWHLYYNMASFLWKGIHLERKLGSAWFFYMLAVFTACTNVLLLYLNYIAAYLLNDVSYLRDCALGFSGVIFAVKVVSTYHMPPGTSLIMGFIPVNSRLACWFELVLIQLLVPNSSFTGHLAGILVGLAYVQGPLKNIMEFFTAFIPRRRNLSFSTRPSYTYRSGTSRGNEENENYNQFTGGLDEDEQYQRAMQESVQQSEGDHRRGFNEDGQYRRGMNENAHQSDGDYRRLYPDLSNDPSAPPHEEVESPPPPGWNIPQEEPHPSPITHEEVRRRRLERFGR